MSHCDERTVIVNKRIIFKRSDKKTYELIALWNKKKYILSYITIYKSKQRRIRLRDNKNGIRKCAWSRKWPDLIWERVWFVFNEMKKEMQRLTNGKRPKIRKLIHLWRENITKHINCFEFESSILCECVCRSCLLYRFYWYELW